MITWLSRISSHLFRGVPGDELLMRAYFLLGVAQFPLHVYAWKREIPGYPLVASLAAAMCSVYWPLSTPCVASALYLRHSEQVDATNDECPK
jgi:hypothetical protein